MPYDSPKATTTQHNGNATTSRPLMPTLAANRAVKSPLTPRLAAQQASASSTPAPSASRPSARSDLSAAKSPATSKEELSTPVRSFLDNNVTPRSSQRKSRADSAQSTPGASNSGTPVIPKLAAKATDDFFTAGPASANRTGQTLSYMGGRNSTNPRARPQSMIIGPGAGQPYALSRPPASGQASPMHIAREESPMFFHADYTKTQSPSLGDARPPLRKGASFFHADGSQAGSEQRGGSPVSNLPSPPLSATGTTISQFFYADGSAERLRDSPPPISPPLQSVSDTQLPATSINHMPNLRPSSPTKGNIHLSYRKGASQVMRPTSIIGARPGEAEGLISRPLSIGSTAKRASLHMKGASLSSIDSISAGSSRRTSSPRSSLAFAKQLNFADANSTRTSSGSDRSPPSKIQMPPLAIDAHQPVATPGPVVTPLSPTKASMTPQMAEMAANARRERKVMDLEISNSSLLAINRQLEREVRRQKTELRRYRRLTRAGRLSVATADSFEADVADFDDSDAEDADLPSRIDLPSSDEGEDYEDFSESDESALSPSALAEHDSKKLAKDERRLRLDLSKHRQLLVDSQKMNQSLRRCLGWTEELIAEGKKALSYRVRVSDVRLGGRVLRRDEDDFEESLEESHEPEQETRPEAAGDDTTAAAGQQEEAKDVAELIGLMSPWTRLASSRSGTATPTRPISGVDVGWGVQDVGPADGSA